MVPIRLLETRSGSSDNTQEIEIKELLPALEEEMPTEIDKVFKETGQAYLRAVTLTYRNARGRAFEKKFDLIHIQGKGFEFLPEGWRVIGASAHTVQPVN